VTSAASGARAAQGPWSDADRRILARMIGELVYEGVLAPVVMADRGRSAEYQLDLASGARYRFEAWRSIWGALDVEPGSVTRIDGEGARPGGFADLVSDARRELGLTDITAGHLLEELLCTAFAEADQRRRLEATSAGEMARLSGVALEALLDAHPKAIGNRGRLGWGSDDIERYAPEHAPRFRLRWVGVRRGLAGGVQH